LNIKKILAGIDFEQDTEKVLSYASFLARQFDASLDLLYVIDYLITPPSYIAPYVEQEKNEALKKFTGVRDLLAKEGIQAKTEVMVGRLQESFETALRKIQADLLVLGFVTHALRRSSAEKLIKGLQMPMLVVRGRKADEALSGSLKVKRILCPFDFSDASEKALEIAGELQGIFSSELHIAHIIPDVINKNIENMDSYKITIHALHEHIMNNMLKVIDEKGIKGIPLVDSGIPAKRIVALSEDRDIDLIVIGARGLGFIKGMLIGSVTDAVLKSSPCPVLVVH
jgi:nucleotide-binding universal stress UspA family protein